MKNNRNKKNNTTNQFIRISEINKEKVKQVATTNKKNVNIIDSCEEFYNKHSSRNFENLKLAELKKITNEGNELINTYFITDAKDTGQTVMKVEAIVISATYTMTVIQNEIAKKNNIRLGNEIRKTMVKAKKLEEESKNRAEQLEDVKNEQKTMIATIISIVLAISIIPTGIAGIEHIGGNYVLPFLASVVTFGLIMIAFTYSLYQVEFKKRIIVFLVLCILCTGALWYLAFNFNISVTPKHNNEAIENQIDSNLRKIERAIVLS